MNSTNLTNMPLGLSFVAVLSLAGCGGSGPDDPLTGTWRNEACFGTESTPSDVMKCGVALTFTDDLGIELEADWVSLPATATHPRCTTTKRVTGQRWSTKQATGSQILTVTGDGTATIERAGCVNMEDDLTAEPTTDIAIPSGEAKYQLTGGKLTILSGDLAGTYTR